MAVDAGDILSSWMQGSNFVNNNIARVEEERRRQELEELQKVAGKGLEIFAPKYDANGKLISRTTGDVFNDPNTLELANHPFMRDVRMQGISDPEVEDVRYIGGVPTPDGTGAVPIVEQVFKDGHVSRGPLTADRSRNPDAKVAPVTLDGMFNHLASAVYARSPDLGKELMNRAHEQALGGLQTQYRTATTQEERNQILAAGQSYGMSAAKIIEGAASSIVQPDLKTGYDVVKDPAGNVSYRENPQTAGLRKQVVAQETQDMLDSRLATQKQDLSFKVDNAPTENALSANSAESLALAELKIKELTATRVRQLQAGDKLAAAATQEQIDALYLNPRLDRKVKEIDVTEDAQAGAGLRNAPTTAATSQITQPGFTTRQGDEKSLLQAREVLNPSAVPALLSKGAAVADQTVLQWGKSLPVDDLRGLYAGLARAKDNGDPAAAQPLETVKRLLHDAAADAGAGQKAEDFKPEDFDKDAVRRFVTNDVPEDVRNKIDLNGAVIFNQTLEQLGALGIQVSKNSANGARLNRAVADSAILQEVAGLGNTAPALYNRENLIPKYGEASTGSPEEFSKDLVLPLGKRMQELKVSTDPKNVIEATEDAVALRSMGIPIDQAVDWAARLGDPAYGNQIAREATQAGAKTMDEVRAFIAAKIKTAPKPTVAERVRGLDRYDPAPALQQLPSQIVGGLRSAVQPPPPGPSEGQNRYKVR